MALAPSYDGETFMPRFQGSGILRSCEKCEVFCRFKDPVINRCEALTSSEIRVLHNHVAACRRCYCSSVQDRDECLIIACWLPLPLQPISKRNLTYCDNDCSYPQQFSLFNTRTRLFNESVNSACNFARVWFWLIVRLVTWAWVVAGGVRAERWVSSMCTALFYRRKHTRSLCWSSFLLLLLFIAGSAYGFCPQDSCTNKYVSLKFSLGVEEGHNAPYCVLLRRYLQCTQSLENLCRGNIKFHSNLKMINSLLDRHRCSEFGVDFDTLIESFDPDSIDSEDSADEKQRQDECQFQGHVSTRAHCGLFGDPHLRTFTGEFVTCGVLGAWPLLDTPHVAVQVTNARVGPYMHATATTKVTVIVRGPDPCGSGKTYEASADQLPRAFVDGTSAGGGESLELPAVWVEEIRPGLHVQISLRTVNTTISVRRIQKYLSVSVTMPDSAVNTEQDQGLCITSCPPSEALASPASEAMPQHQAEELCSLHNLTDCFLDACVFDLTTTGETFFREAAAAAQSELWTHDPLTAASTLRNCTQWPCKWPASTSASSASALHWSVLLVLVAAVTYSSLPSS
ncbi:Repulsive guidance molecule C-terminal [Trinorchestia longiramus]|nr:Repulsive guidance molecule C-terminal [Trinorchestia longiramus]